MTRTDVMASSRPRTANGAPSRKGSSSMLRGLSVFTVVLLLGLALVVPSVAVAEEPTAGYNQKPNTPKTGTSPSKEAAKPTTTPTTAVAPVTTSSTPSAKASTLPFTGFDLRWDIGFGVLLMGAGFSILAMQRRQRRQGRASDS